MLLTGADEPSADEGTRTVLEGADEASADEETTAVLAGTDTTAEADDAATVGTLLPVTETGVAPGVHGPYAAWIWPSEI